MGGVPPAGSMNVLSVTPIEAGTDTLIENGSFEDWLVGAPVPRGNFVGPNVSSRRSTLSQTTQASDGSQALVQTWSQTDWGAPPSQLFGILISGLEAGANYRLRLDADTKNAGSGYVQVYPTSVSRGDVALAEIELTPARDFKEHAVVFNTGEERAIRIVTRGPADPAAYPNSIVFDNWRLGKTKEPVTPVTSVEPSGGLVPNGNFAQWPTGQLLPGAPFVSPNDASTLSRVSEGADGKPYALRQRWTDGKNSIWDTDRLMDIRASLKPHTRYRVKVKVNTLGEHRPNIDVYGVRGGIDWHPLSNYLIKPEPAEGWQEYSGIFDTGELQDIRVTTATFFLSEDTNTCEVHWDDWELEEVGPSPETVIPPPEEGNLITNGSFEAWVPGRPKPEGDVIAPSPESGNSSIMRVLRARSDGEVSLEQTWTASDINDEAQNLFGYEFTNLKPEHQYRFTCSAYHFNNQPHDVRIFAIQEGGRYMPLTRIQVGGKARYQWEEFSFIFDTRMFSSIKIGAQGPSGRGFPYRMIWDNWRLEEVGPSGDSP